jgi:hypothetical protein
MDTYSTYQGVTVPEIVTGKPVGSGGTLGRREATGHGVVHLAVRAMERLGVDRSGATAIVGVWQYRLTRGAWFCTARHKSRRHQRSYDRTL